MFTNYFKDSFKVLTVTFLSMIINIHFFCIKIIIVYSFWMDVKTKKRDAKYRNTWIEIDAFLRNFTTRSVLDFCIVLLRLTIRARVYTDRRPLVQPIVGLVHDSYGIVSCTIRHVTRHISIRGPTFFGPFL
jgi:hypothetical protein